MVLVLLCTVCVADEVCYIKVTVISYNYIEIDELKADIYLSVTL